MVKVGFFESSDVPGACCKISCGAWVDITGRTIDAEVAASIWADKPAFATVSELACRMTDGVKLVSICAAVWAGCCWRRNTGAPGAALYKFIVAGPAADDGAGAACCNNTIVLVVEICWAACWGCCCVNENCGCRGALCWEMKKFCAIWASPRVAGCGTPGVAVAVMPPYWKRITWDGCWGCCTIGCALIPAGVWPMGTTTGGRCCWVGDSWSATGSSACSPLRFFDRLGLEPAGTLAAFAGVFAVVFFRDPGFACSDKNCTSGDDFSAVAADMLAETGLFITVDGAKKYGIGCVADESIGTAFAVGCGWANAVAATWLSVDGLINVECCKDAEAKTEVGIPAVVAGKDGAAKPAARAEGMTPSNNSAA